MSKMKVEHTLTIVATCPMNGLQDVYQATFRLSKLVPVENILAHATTLTGVKIFQEELTQKLAAAFRCEVETLGTHSGVTTRCICK